MYHKISGCVCIYMSLIWCNWGVEYLNLANIHSVRWHDSQKVEGHDHDCEGECC